MIDAGFSIHRMDNTKMALDGKRIKELREKKGLTQHDLAMLIKKREQAVSKWENQKSEPGVATTLALAKVLDTNLFYLLGWNVPTDPLDAQTIRAGIAFMQGDVSGAMKIALEVGGQVLENMKKIARQNPPLK